MGADATEDFLAALAFLYGAHGPEPLNCAAIVQRACRKGYWRSDGKTPAATIYAAMLGKTQKKGDEARFRKAERDRFEFAG